jgi:hypothetical protein
VLARGHQSGAVFTIVAAAKQSGVVTFTSVNVIKFVLINIVRTSPLPSASFRCFFLLSLDPTQGRPRRRPLGQLEVRTCNQAGGQHGARVQDVTRILVEESIDYGGWASWASRPSQALPFDS